MGVMDVMGIICCLGMIIALDTAALALLITVVKD